MYIAIMCTGGLLSTTDVRTIAFAICSSCKPRGPVVMASLSLKNRRWPTTCVLGKKSRLKLQALSGSHTSTSYQPACGWACQINIELALSKLPSRRNHYLWSIITHFGSVLCYYDQFPNVIPKQNDNIITANCRRFYFSHDFITF